jgi:hypothetical protein
MGNNLTKGDQMLQWTSHGEGWYTCSTGEITNEKVFKDGKTIIEWFFWDEETSMTHGPYRSLAAAKVQAETLNRQKKARENK